MLKKNILLPLIHILGLALSAFSSVSNTVVITPLSGTIITSEVCTVAVTSSKPLDSVVLSIEYRTEQGSVRRKSLGTITTPPYRMIVPTAQFGNQYFFGADLIAAVHRQDDTVQLVNSPRLFFIPQPIPTQSLPFYQTGSGRSVPIGDRDSITITRDPRGIAIRFSIPYKAERHSSVDPIVIVLDPRVSRTPFPGSNTIILSVPLSAESQLITSSERLGSEMFTISRTGTPIHLKKDITLKDNELSGSITIPDFLLGGTVNDTIGINVVLPQPAGTAKRISFVSGEEYHQYCPILFPLFVQTELPQKASSFPLKEFFIALLAGVVTSAVVVLTRKNPPLSSRSTREPAADLIVLIEEHIVNPDLNAEFLAHKLGCTTQKIHREIKQVTGKRLSSYIEDLRIEIVKERLISSNASEISIATDCGFKTTAAMENAFHKYTGVAPYQFRDTHGMK